MRFLIISLLLMDLAFAGDIVVNACKLKILRALDVINNRSVSEYDIVEYRLDRPIGDIFGDNYLKLAPLETKFQEKKALYRYPGVAKKVLNTFEQKLFISNAPAEKIADHLETNVIYTYAIQDKKLTFAKSKPGLLRDYLSKHMLLSANTDDGLLRMAGEMWKDEKGIIHFDPGSGTYKPTGVDLERAEVFFKEHLGLKTSQAHYFTAPTAPANSTAAPAKPLLSKVAHKFKEIEQVQTAILTNRRILAGYKFFVNTSSGIKDKQSMKANTIRYQNSQGQEVEYELRPLDATVNELVKFDTADLTLHKKKAQIITKRLYHLNQKTKPMTLKSDVQMMRQANLAGAGNSPIVAVLTQKEQIEEFGLFPVGSTQNKPSFTISLKTNTYTGLAGKIKGKSKVEYSTSIEVHGASNAELDLLSKQIQKNSTFIPQSSGSSDLFAGL